MLRDQRNTLIASSIENFDLSITLCVHAGCQRTKINDFIRLAHTLLPCLRARLFNIHHDDTQKSARVVLDILKTFSPRAGHSSAFTRPSASARAGETNHSDNATSSTSAVYHNTLDSVHFTVTYVVKLMRLAARERTSKQATIMHMSLRARARPMEQYEERTDTNILTLSLVLSFVRMVT